jgi:hypothetical protein
VTVSYSLGENNVQRLDYRGSTTRPTLVSLRPASAGLRQPLDPDGHRPRCGLAGRWCRRVNTVQEHQVGETVGYYYSPERKTALPRHWLGFTKPTSFGFNPALLSQTCKNLKR